MTATEQDSWHSFESLLALIADPKACNQRVVELKEEQDRLQEIIAEDQALAAEIEDERMRADKTLAAAMQEMESAQRRVDEARRREARCDERAVALDKWERELRQFEGELKQKERAEALGMRVVI
jgi:chromosome segregation ATPase